ncbi:MAG: hypothetical protein HY819_11560 [Acidobacteria bacterium]|nr:hypothetical protein [Acidobacteriota bacterium]
MKKLYKYLGKEENRVKSKIESGRQLLTNQEDVLNWLKKNGHKIGENKEITATFIVDKEERMWIADRNSEHVLCAKGEDVLSAGEITFCLIKNKIMISGITNQSTGYCPEPDSWPCVSISLDKVGLQHPAFFTSVFLFRFCYHCSSINIIKDDWFFCSVCNSSLSEQWNFVC